MRPGSNYAVGPLDVETGSRGPSLATGRTSREGGWRGAWLESSARHGLAGGSSFDLACALLLGVSVLLPGIVVLLDLPHSLELIADLGSAALVGWIVLILLMRRVPLAIPYVVLAYLVVVIAGSAIADDPARTIVGLKNYMLLPALAIGLASLAPSESRTRLLCLTALVLAGAQFVVSILQSLTVPDIDLVVGTFGDWAGPSLAFAAVAGSCVALGAFAARVPRSAAWLVVAIGLPLLSIWAALRIVPVELPATGAAVAVAAWWAGRREENRARRPAIVAGAAALTVVVLAVSYAVARPFDFQLFTDSQARGVYLREATVVEDPDPNAGDRPIPGRGEQIRTTIEAVSGGVGSFALGHGVGATSYAENLGVEQPTERSVALAGYSEAGTLLYELGWLGVALVAACGVALALSAIAAAPLTEPGTWARALLIGYPGVVVAMAVGGFHGTPFRNIGSAILFWVLTGVALGWALHVRRNQPPGA